MKNTEGPDRGWSWVIAIAAFLVTLILAGIFRTSGVLFVAFIQEFGVSREEASWPAVLCFAVFHLIGIVIGPLEQKFGIRPIVLFGALLGAIGISSCYFVTSLTAVIVLYGVVFGAGLGICMTVIPCIVNVYFVKHRATANGFALSGSCFGAVIFPPLFEFFIEEYDLFGCFLLMGGIVLQVAISGVLMRPAPWLRPSKFVKSNIKNSAVNDSKILKTNGLDAVATVAGSLCVSVRYDVGVDEDESSKTFNGQQGVAVNYQERKAFKNPVCETSGGNGTSYMKREHQVDEKDFAGIENPAFTDERSQSDMNLEKYNDDQLKIHSAASVETKHSCRNIKDSHCRSEKEDIGKKSIKSAHSILRTYQIIWTCPMFYVTGISYMVFVTLYNVFLLIIIDYSVDRGIPAKDAQYILFGFAIADLFGRLGFGWITDRKFLRRHHYVMLNITLISLIFFLIPFASSLEWLVAASSCYGLLLGCTVIMFPILLVDYMGMEINVCAIGCMCFLNGLSSFTNPSFIGHIRDRTGSYSLVFYILGGISLATASLWMLERCFVEKISSISAEKSSDKNCTKL